MSREHGEEALGFFFDQFYGEAFEIKSGCEFKRKEDKKPFACIVWSGEGNVNGNKVSAILETGREFFVAAKTGLNIKNTGRETLIIYAIFPIGED